MSNWRGSVGFVSDATCTTAPSAMISPIINADRAVWLVRRISPSPTPLRDGTSTRKPSTLTRPIRLGLVKRLMYPPWIVSFLTVASGGALRSLFRRDVVSSGAQPRGGEGGGKVLNSTGPEKLSCRARITAACLDGQR